MLIIKFEQGGKVTLSPTGYPGVACTKVTEHYTRYMAGDAGRSVPTAEMNEPESGVVNSNVKTAREA